MDNRSPRSKEILGPRPTPLKISKDSHKIIKKPPLAPHPRLQPYQEPSQPPSSRGPVIIYTVSPKIIHTHPNNFMTLVQRLTGKTSMPSTSAPNKINSRNTSENAFSGSVSPAARYAATERANELGFVGDLYATEHNYNQNRGAIIEVRPGFCPNGILSPGPTSLPSISPNFFSPVTTDPQGLSSFYNDFNSILQTSSSTIPSPSSMDIFNNFFDS
ncbi:unnamed protein product [Cochlearia groenlandica]